MPKNKVVSLETALNVVNDGATVMISGFTNVGSPNKFCRALADKGIKDLTLITNDAGNDKVDGIGTLVCEKRVKKLTASHVGLNPQVAVQMNAGELEVELVSRMGRTGGDRRRMLRCVEVCKKLREAAFFNTNPAQMAGWLCAGIFSV